MVWYNLKIGLFELKYTPLKATEKSFPLCDENGSALKKVVNSGTSYFVDSEGNKVSKAYRLINGKPLDKLSKTKEVTRYVEVENSEVEDLLVEKQYLVNCPLLLRELEGSGKCLKFAFTNGNGYKVFKAYIHKSNLYKDFLFMSLGNTQKSEIIGSVVEKLKDEKKSKAIEVTISQVNKASVEDLLEVVA